VGPGVQVDGSRSGSLSGDDYLPVLEDVRGSNTEDVLRAKAHPVVAGTATHEKGAVRDAGLGIGLRPRGNRDGESEQQSNAAPSNPDRYAAQRDSFAHSVLRDCCTFDPSEWLLGTGELLRVHQL